MNQSTEIIKDLVNPFLQQNERESLDINWENILIGFAAYENNDQLLRNEINKLKLINKNEIISVLPDLYDSFLDELAEQFVKGNSSEASRKLFTDKNRLFTDKVNFYISLKGVVTKMERKRIINELKADEIFSENNLELAFKKKGREELEEKFKIWDKELEVERQEKPKGKLISLFTTKFAIAASIALLIGISLFKTFNTPNTYSFQTTILSQTGMGFANNEKSNEAEVIFKDTSGLFRSDTKNEYTFINNILIIYTKKPEGKFHLIELDSNQFYLHMNNHFYQLKETEISLPLVEENDMNIREQLEKIIFINE